MYRILFFLTCLSAAVFSSAEEIWFGIYIQDKKVGYSMALDDSVTGPGVARHKSVSETVLQTGMMGSELNLKISSTTLSDAQGKPISIHFETSSGGRSQVVDALFSKDSIKTSINNNGTKTQKTLKIPEGTQVVDDPTSAMAAGILPTKSLSVMVLDPTTVSLIENKIVPKGKVKTDIKGVQYDASLVVIEDPRANTNIYFSSKGDVIKMEGAMGMTLLPEPKAIAMKIEGSAANDLAEMGAVKIDKPIERPWEAKGVTISFKGVDLQNVPNDNNQSLTKSEAGFTISTHSPASDPKLFAAIETGAVTIQKAGQLQPQWVKAGMHIPTDDGDIKAIAVKSVGGETNVIKASVKIAKVISSFMRPNGGIGVLRDAKEVLASKEGVCRDYAILGASMMRSVGIPVKLVSGIIYEGGQFYYHAWDEVFDGTQWVPIDPTRANNTFDATHIKMAEGTVEDAFTFKVLDHAKLSLIEVRYRQ